jgi:hypothetical protein
MGTAGSSSSLENMGIKQLCPSQLFKRTGGWMRMDGKWSPKQFSVGFQFPD